MIETESDPVQGSTVNFVNADEVTEAIVKRLTADEIGPDLSEYLRKLAGNGNYYWTTSLFGGPLALLLEATAHSDGSLSLRLNDPCMSMVWQTRLRPAA